MPENHDASLAASFKSRHIGLGGFTPDLVRTVRAAGWAPVEEIVTKVRQNCTPSSEAYTKGGDYLVREVADWIENPPEWVKAPWSVATTSDSGRA